MRDQKRILAVMRSQEAVESLSEVLAGNGAGAEFEVRSGDITEIREAMNGSLRPDVLFVDIAFDDNKDLDTLSRFIKENGSTTSVIVTSANATLAGVRQLMRLGVVDFVPQPISRHDIFSALELAASKTSSATPSSHTNHRVFSFIRSRGGAGATTLAVQAARSLMDHGPGKPKVCLLDLDLQFGNAAMALDLKNKLTILDILQSPDSADGAFLQAAMAHHKTGLDVLAAPDQIVPLEALTPDLAAKVVQLAKDEYEYVIIDMPLAWAAWTGAVLGKSDVIFLVTQMSVSGIRHSRRQIDMLRNQGLDAVPTLITANRFKKSLGNRKFIREAEKVLGRRIDHFVPSDYKTTSKAQDFGVHLSDVRRRSVVEKNVTAMMAASIKLAQGNTDRIEPVLVH